MPVDDRSPVLPLRWDGTSTGTGTNLDDADGGEVDGTDVATRGAPDDLEHEPAVDIRISARRRKTATAFWEEGRIVVVLPAHVRGRQRDEMIAWLIGRVRAKRPGLAGSDHELTERATALADRYVDGVRPRSVHWVTNQSKRWGSCSPSRGEIRISHRLRSVPDWVLDAILVHELTHLVHSDHSPEFHRVANRYPRQQDASIFLEGYHLGLQQPGMTAHRNALARDSK